MLYLLIGATLISFSAVFVKLAHVGPTTSAFYRLSFGGLTLLMVALIRREPLWQGRKSLLWVALAGVALFLDLFFWHRSIFGVGPGLATLLANLQVITLAVIGILFMGEALTWRVSVAVPLSLTGLGLIVGLDWSALAPEYRLGVIFGLITAVCYTGLTLSLRKSQTIRPKLPPVANMAWVSLIGALLTAVALWQNNEGFAVPDTRTWLVLIVYGALCTAAGWGFISAGLPRVEASRAGLILILQPTLSYVWDVLFFDLPITRLQILGAAMTIFAIYLGAARRREA